MNDSFLSLGSNMGNRLDMLKGAVQLLMDHSSIRVVAMSSLYETDPVGFTAQDPFLNMVVRLETELNALALLDACQEIEQKLNRERLIRWGPRTIDLDILLYNQENIKTERLIVPHPRMHDRAFVLIPLLELDSSLTGFEEPPSQGVRLWRTYNSVEEFTRQC